MTHAYLITAYSNFKVLSLLLRLLDDEHNILFVHVDKKVTFDQEAFQKELDITKAALYFVPRYDLTWADVSEIHCVLDSMEYALRYDWDYIHYITEGDLPLKTQKEIHSYFEKNNGFEFIDFAPENYKLANYKCQVFHPFLKFKSYRKNKFLKLLNHGFAHLQQLLGVRRSSREFKHGSGYFSITRSFAEYAVSKKEIFYKQYRDTLCCLEVYLQTLCYYSPYRKKVKYFEQTYLGNLRYIDWSRRDGSSPYTFQLSDYDDLIDKAEHSELCFARKFNQNSDFEIAEKLYDYILSKQSV
jgi:hypothetical protein